jgi:hypothetical protein
MFAFARVCPRVPTQRGCDKSGESRRQGLARTPGGRMPRATLNRRHEPSEMPPRGYPSRAAAAKVGSPSVFHWGADGTWTG